MNNNPLSPIFDKTVRPDSSLVHRSHDPFQDTRLGEILKFEPKYFDDCNVVIVGCPQDEGVTRNHGRMGARYAPDKIREWLYKFSFSKSVEGLGIFDLGNIEIGETLEQTHIIQYEVIHELLQNNKKVIILGGGNDISYPDCKALSDSSSQIKTLMAINIDKHFDCRSITDENYSKKSRNMTSGTPYAFLLNDKLVSASNFIEFGYIPFFNSKNYTEYLQSIGVHLVSLEKARKNGIINTLSNLTADSNIDHIFWGFDLDSVSSVFAPGVSSSYPIGFSGDEILAIAKLSGSDPRSKIFEFTEVNPEYDLDNRTVKLVAMIVYTVLHEISLL